MYKNKKTNDNTVKKIAKTLWFYLMGTEAIYHLFKGLTLTAYFTVYQPFLKFVNTSSKEQDMIGASLFSLDAWVEHFRLGIRGPAVLFTAYLLYKYTMYLNPFKKKPFHKHNNRPHHHNQSHPHHNKQNNFSKSNSR
ncbi:MAG: hypothetical protein COB02_06755 [Candidatus Cloacimonadota bacterium]|nr:MAG: hypothetical protein COB02_06755 [Candidatus Cloacimonadota bacterium]